MNRILLHAMIGLVVTAALSGCGRRRVRATNTTTYQQQQTGGGVGVSASAGGLSAGVRVEAGFGGVTAVQQQCNPNAGEACNGLDDNCNGIIDEGCGYSSGNIQITLAWGSGADLDMYVTDPTGYTISYSRRNSPSGGHLDHDARGACVRAQADATIENVYWDSPRPPSGTYRVEVHNYSGCRVSNVTPATLSIAVGGQVIGAYNVALRPGERQAVAEFYMP